MLFVRLLDGLGSEVFCELSLTVCDDPKGLRSESVVSWQWKDFYSLESINHNNSFQKDRECKFGANLTIGQFKLKITEVCSIFR